MPGAFGERMQRERELRGVTLEEISVVTKIGTRSLKALEEEDFDKLPGGIFNKGFVRAYARYLGIDPDEAVADYLAAVEQRNRPVGIEGGAAAEPAREALPDFTFAQEPQESSSSSGLVLVGILVVAALVAAIWWVLAGHGSSITSAVKKALGRQTTAEASTPTDSGAPAMAARQSDQAGGVAPDTARSQPTGRAPVLAEVSPSMLSPAARAAQERAAAAKKAEEEAPKEKPEPISTSVTTVAPGTGFTVHLRAEQDSWVTVTADGKVVSKGLLAAGDERSIRAGTRVIVRLGNAGGVQVAFNGSDLPAVGAVGEVKTLAFGPNGREAYTPPPPPPPGPAVEPAANPQNPQ